MMHSSNVLVSLYLLYSIYYLCWRPDEGFCCSCLSVVVVIVVVVSQAHRF